MDSESLRERYASASDDELRGLAARGSELTTVAWMLLRDELTRRGLRQGLVQPPPSDRPDAPSRPTGEARDAAPPAVEPQVARPRFTGDGGEYFRIWIVNVLITLCTLGVYSAWAKVRKARYFRNNTQLDGHVLDYHGNPAAILRGRLLALVLFTAYSWAFAFSKVAGLVTVAVLCLAGPWLVLRAQQFALRNTSFRGLRFGFRARAREAYVSLLPVLVLWLSPAVFGAFVSDAWWLGATALGVPWMHHQLKAFQRDHATYGDQAFSFTRAVARFYAVYAKGVGFVLLGSLTGGVVMVAIFALRRDALVYERSLEWFVYVGIIMLVMYVVAWPYYAARVQQLVWSRTHLGGVRFHTEIRAWPLFRLVLRNAVLTVATAGVYWPWAAVALARYRIECVRVESELPLSALAVGIQAPAVSAVGEGAADAFGLDIGL